MIRFRVIGISKDRRSADLKERGEALERANKERMRQARQDEIDALLLNAYEYRVRLNVFGIRRARDEHTQVPQKRLRAV